MTHTYTVTYGGRVVYTGPDKDKADEAWSAVEFRAMSTGTPAQYAIDGQITQELES